MTTPINIEWANVPSGASIDAFGLINGVVTPKGNYPIAAGTGSQLFAPITFVGPSFPFSAGLRYDTIANGGKTYESTLLVTCPALDGAGTAQIINGAPPIPALSPWGLTALAAFVALIGLAVLRRAL